MKTEERDYKKEFEDFLKQYMIYDAFILALKRSKHLTFEEFLETHKTDILGWTTNCFTWSSNLGINWNKYHNMWNNYLHPPITMQIRF
jgi:nitrogenase molybdenum-iron protein alpha/beta subunit